MIRTGEPAAPSPARDAATGTSRLPGRGVRPLLAVVGVLVLFGLLYWLTVHVNSGHVNSDGATVVLQGRAMADGNLTLHGWTLSLDSWWTLDVPFYAVATALVGIRPGLLLVVPAVIATLAVCFGVAIARRGRSGPAPVAGGVLVLAVLALPGYPLASLLAVGPIHVSTALFTLVAFLCLRRGTLDRLWPVGVVALAAGLLGDLQMAAYGVGPVLLAGLAAMARRRSLRAGAPTAAAAVGSVLLALLVRGIADVIGTFALGPTNPRAPLAQVERNLHHLPRALSALLGVTSDGFGTDGVPVWLERVHVVLAVVLGVAALLTLVRLVRGVLLGVAPAERSRHSTPQHPAAQDSTPHDPEPWRLDDMLLLGALGSIGAFAVLSLSDSIAYFRYLTAAVIFLAVLAGRVLTGWWAANDRRLVRRPAGAVLAAATLACAATVGYQIDVPVATEPGAVLATFFEAHHLRSGVGDYWSSSITTVASSDHVRVRPVAASPAGTLEAYNKGPVAAWFHEARFRFVVYQAPVGYDGVTRAVATRTWGAPARSYALDGYEILVWAHAHRITRREPRDQ